MFQSTRPARGATSLAARLHGLHRVSIHAPRAGRDLARRNTTPELKGFNPRAPRGARPGQGGEHRGWDGVSIHAPRAGRDGGWRHEGLRDQSFNPRAPRGARRRRRQGFPKRGVSIHAPRAGRDFSISIPCVALSCFNPRAPRGARPAAAITTWRFGCFNPRAPRGARRHLLQQRGEVVQFQSTRPARGATATSQTVPRLSICCFNPRARAGRDVQEERDAEGERGFNPRAPRGARPVTGNRIRSTDVRITVKFQSTRPARGATANQLNPSRATGFRPSSAKPCAERDPSRRWTPTLHAIFLTLKHLPSIAIRPRNL